MTIDNGLAVSSYMQFAEKAGEIADQNMKQRLSTIEAITTTDIDTTPGTLMKTNVALSVLDAKDSAAANAVSSVKKSAQQISQA